MGASLHHHHHHRCPESQSREVFLETACGTPRKNNQVFQSQCHCNGGISVLEMALRDFASEDPSPLFSIQFLTPYNGSPSAKKLWPVVNRTIPMTPLRHPLLSADEVPMARHAGALDRSKYAPLRNLRLPGTQPSASRTSFHLD